MKENNSLFILDAGHIDRKALLVLEELSPNKLLDRALNKAGISARYILAI